VNLLFFKLALTFFQTTKDPQITLSLTYLDKLFSKYLQENKLFRKLILTYERSLIHSTLSFFQMFINNQAGPLYCRCQRICYDLLGTFFFQVRTLSETVRLDARTKLLNPKWYEGMLSTGYEGVREIEKRLTNTVGWSATSGQVDNWVYEEANTTFIQDEQMLNKLMNTNPNSFRKLVQTFLEANGRGYWETSEDNIEKLRQLYSEVEDKIEGIDR